MKTTFALQSIGTVVSEPASRVRRTGPIARRRCRTAKEWLAYFRRNAARCRPIPWEVGAQVPADQLAPITRSLQAWQLGETSDGRHLLAAAARYAERLGEPAYYAAV